MRARPLNCRAVITPSRIKLKEKTVAHVIGHADVRQKVARLATR
jgi:hypothetical protein